MASVKRLSWRKRIAVGLQALLTCFLCLNGCSVKRMAVHSFADALTEGSVLVYASDNDPELVGQALPFSLKTIEALLQSAPRHRGLLLAAASGFVQYSHAYVLAPAVANEFHDRKAARTGKARARKLFLRAYEYGLRALELRLPQIRQELQYNPVKAVADTKAEDVPVLYWTAAALGSAISVAKDDMALVADLPVVAALLDRALELDESWGEGALHEFYIVLAMSQSTPGAVETAEKHFRRALALSSDHTISPQVTFAESVCVPQQDRSRFQALLKQALQYDVERYPENRLANILAQRKAAHLLENIDYLFFANDDEMNSPADLSKTR